MAEVGDPLCGDQLVGRAIVPVALLLMATKPQAQALE